MLIDDLVKRSGNSCELCMTDNDLTMYEVPFAAARQEAILICATCETQINKQEQMDPGHWKVLSETMWSEYPAVQVVAWRMLSRLRQESWAADLLEILYLDDDTAEWAKKTGDHEQDASVEFHKDSNGTRLYEGDTVILTKTLDVKGSSVAAKLGTVVKNIRLVPETPTQIEGKIEGQTIVILTKYLRKN